MLRVLAAALLSLAPVPALAECPETLGAGIVVASGFGGIATITPTDRPGVFGERMVFDDGGGYELHSFYGIYPLLSIDFDAGGDLAETVETVVYADPPSAPEPGQAVQGIVGRVSFGGLEFDRRHDLRAYEMSEVVIGACTYPAFAVELVIYDPDHPRQLNLVFLPDLGVALVVGFMDAHGQDGYDLLDIATLGPDPAP